MSISHETSRRALRWNSLTRALLASLLLVLSTVLPAQDSEAADRAILVTGPSRLAGIDFLEPNVIPHWYGIYRRGAAAMHVYFLDVPVEAAAQWDRVSCTERILRSSPDQRYYYHQQGAWTLFVAVSPLDTAVLDDVAAPPVESEFPCLFVDRFVTRLIYFQGAEGPRASPDDPPAFPAVLDLAAPDLN